MIDAESKRALLDDEHLRLLSLGFLVSGCMTALFSLFGLLYAGMGVMMASMASAMVKPGAKPSEAPPVEVAWILGIAGGLLFVVMAALALAKFWTAWNLHRRQGRIFCIVVAAVSCPGFPYGTCLGVCTLIVLTRASVAKLFQPSLPPRCIPAPASPSRDGSP